MKTPSMSLKQAQEISRWWNQNAYKHRYEAPAYVEEAFVALEFYQHNPPPEPEIVVATTPNVISVVKPKRRGSADKPVYRVHTATATGPAQIAYLRQHPEFTIKEMAEALGISYPYACEVIRLNNIEHCSGKKAKAA